MQTITTPIVTECPCDYTRYIKGHHTSGRTRAYRIWDGMRQRCDNPNHIHYADYGGRGITYYERWKSFDNFFADMGHPPEDLTLDRINNNEGYSSDNCEWQTMEHQANHRRSTRLITFSGLTLSIKDWSIKTGIPRETLIDRFNRGFTRHILFQEVYLNFNRDYPASAFQ